MIGAIAGDIVGSIYENHNIKSKDFEFFGEGCRYTDDTVCTVAIAECLMDGGDFADYLSRYALRYPSRGYGARFWEWAKQWSHEPYGSIGNGSAMRVSPVAYFARDEEELLQIAEKSASVTHNHPDAVNGAMATAWSIWAALKGEDRVSIKREVIDRFGYNLNQSVDDIRSGYNYDVTCKGTVPPAIVCSLDACDYEDAIRNAISIGGDSDTIACISGGIAEALFGIPEWIDDQIALYLPDAFIKVIKRFSHITSRPVEGT